LRRKHMRAVTPLVVFLGLALFGYPPRVLAGDRPRNPKPVARAAPRAGFPPLRVHVTARLEGGDDTEAWYCPAVEWSIRNVEMTTALRESDCPPYDQREEYPRSWSRDYVLPAGDWTVVVRFLHGDRVLGVAEAPVRVLGGE
jgi:hypothetical protein